MSLYYITAHKPKLASNDHNILGGKLTKPRRNAQTLTDLSLQVCNTQEGIHRRSERTLRAFSSLDRTPQRLARYTRIGVSDLDSAIWDGTTWKTKHSSACRRIMMMFNFTFRSCTKHLYHVITNFYKRVTLPLSTGVMNMESRLPAFIAKYNTETKL